MSRKPLFWSLLSLICLCGAAYFWHLGNQWQAEKFSHKAASPIKATPSLAAPTTPGLPATKTQTNSISSSTAASKSASKRFPYRLSNTDQTSGQLLRNPKGILLENALIDTAQPVNLSIPQKLRAMPNSGGTGSYIVQANGNIDDNFRALLQQANATIVSYVPNNAYLVRVSDAGAQQIAASGGTQSVLPFEPYYKLEPSLLQAVMEDQAYPGARGLNVVVYADAQTQTLQDFRNLGAMVTSQDSSPFGPVFTVQPAPESLAQLATLPGVKWIAPTYTRKQANDLTGLRLGVIGSSTKPAGTDSWLGLTGSNIVVNINDFGVDASHPDLMGRIFSDSVFNLTDTSGHGTHVAGTILGTGLESPSSIPLQPVPGSPTNSIFAGMAPNATAYVLSLKNDSDSYLQQQAAEQTNVFISNNSWNYDDAAYDLAAASYDAAVRDALPYVTGSQPMLYVFSAGNEGGGNTDGSGGNSDTILSPATAKNVITVGAIEQPRYITGYITKTTTNYVVIDGVTNTQIIYAETDSDDEVADFSSRGNVGVGVEGDNGRYKPDVVSPGTFVVSCRSTTPWDEKAYFNPTNYYFEDYTNQVLETNALDTFFVPVPFGIIGINITVISNALSPTNFASLTFPIYAADNNFPNIPGDLVGPSPVSLPGGSVTVLNPGDTIYFDVGCSVTNMVNFDVLVEIITTNDVGTYYTVLSNLDNQLGPYYRYESGTSMGAAGISGLLACMEDFFINRGITNSPALMKALLINGSRTVSDQYDMCVQNGVTSQGWGLPYLQNSIPIGISNLTASTTGSGSAPVQFFDQSPTNALATGQSITWTVGSFTPAALNQDMRITLVWTDPPGDPAVGIKLVNNLVLIVTNQTTGEIFYGNDIPSGFVYNESWDTNNPPPIDLVNNVQNVYLAGPLDGTSYSVTVLAERVNVNAVTAGTNVAQDFALVISSGDASSDLTSAFNITEQNPGVLISNYVTNVFALIDSVPLLNQRVGANPQWASLTNGTSMTNGLPSQWNFYVYTNTPAATNANFTNVAIVTFLPANLSLPRIGALNQVGSPPMSATRFFTTLADGVDGFNNNGQPSLNATRYAGADIDLYVLSDPILGPTLTNLNPAAVAAAQKSVARNGNQTVVFTNSTANQVYYIGVKSEDQEGAQYSLFGFATDLPFNSQNTNGDVTVTMLPVPGIIPFGSPQNPSIVRFFGITTQPIMIRKVVVTNTVTAQDFGDYIGTLSQGQQYAVLNNHTFFTNTLDLTETFVYDDTGDNQIPGSRHTDGPGSLMNFVTSTATSGGASAETWMFTMVNDSSLTDTGQVDSMSLFLEHQPPPNQGYYATISGDSYYYGYVDVPATATNLTVSVIPTSTPATPLDLMIGKGYIPTTSVYDEITNISTSGGSLSVTAYQVPPLTEGRYYYAIFNPNSSSISVYILAQLFLSLTSGQTNTYTSGATIPILDDGVTDATIFVDNTNTLTAVEAGVRIIHPRESDLVLTLISPSGTRTLLAENRGGLDTNGYGSGISITNYLGPVLSGGASGNTNVITNSLNYGTLDVSYNFFTIPDDMQVFYDGVQIYDTGLVSYTGNFSVNFGPGASSNVVIVMDAPGYGPSGTNGDVWTYTPTIVLNQMSYAIFTENTNLTTTPIKFAVPPFGAGSAQLPETNVVVSGFEGDPATTYTSFVPDAGGSGTGWTVTGNPVTVVTVGTNVLSGSNAVVLANTGSNVLALHNGGISRILPTQAGQTYTLSYAYHGRPALTPISWWKGEDNFLDSAGNNVGYPSGGVTFAPGVVGQAFDFSTSSNRIHIDDPPDLALTNAITVEAWVNPYSSAASGIVQRGDSRAEYDPYVLGVSPPTTGGQCDLGWQITDASNNQVVLFGPMALNTFTHVAGTFTRIGTNGLPGPGTNGVLCLYINGALVAQTNTGIAPFGELVGANGGVGIGNCGDLINNFPFSGLIDEVAIYGQALSQLQVQDIYAAGSAGKCPVNGGSCLVTASMIINGNTNIISGVDQWMTNTFTFTAPTNNMTFAIQANDDGMLMDSFVLTQLPTPNPANYYLPEESLAKLQGEDPYGDWTLEIVDNRVGATNPQPTLVSWELNLTVTDFVPLPTPLIQGTTQTNTVEPGGFYYYVVNVPLWALHATNIVNVVNASAPINLYYNPNTLPTGTNSGDIELLSGVPSGTVTLKTTKSNPYPQLIPGEPYYLGVQNTGNSPLTVSVEVNFDITALTNGVLVYSNVLAASSVPRYYEYNVSSAATAVDFQILQPSGNVELVAALAPTLPDESNFSYLSDTPGTNDQLIFITTNSAPTPLTPGLWYIGVFNTDTNAVSYSIMATESDPPSPTIITLTNGVPYTATNYIAGAALTNFYQFGVGVSNVSALFEVYNMSGNVDLTLQRSNLPYPNLPYAPPYFASSFYPGTNGQEIIIRTNVLGTNIAGIWYLGVPNGTLSNVTYTIRATVDTNGLLISPFPIIITPTMPPAGSGVGPTLSFPTVPGECYEIEKSTNLPNWLPGPIIQAGSSTTTYTDPTPPSGAGGVFYRVLQVLCSP